MRLFGESNYVTEKLVHGSKMENSISEAWAHEYTSRHHSMANGTSFAGVSKIYMLDDWMAHRGTKELGQGTTPSVSLCDAPLVGSMREISAPFSTHRPCPDL